jgi:hypothetical protein
MTPNNRIACGARSGQNRLNERSENPTARMSEEENINSFDGLLGLTKFKNRYQIIRLGVLISQC